MMQVVIPNIILATQFIAYSILLMTQEILVTQEETNQLTAADFSSFIKSCQLIGIKSNDFETPMRTVIELVIIGSDESLPSRELKIPLLFLMAIETLLNSTIRVN
jgi:hypothetical protein